MTYFTLQADRCNILIFYIPILSAEALVREGITSQTAIPEHQPPKLILFCYFKFEDK